MNRTLGIVFLCATVLVPAALLSSNGRSTAPSFRFSVLGYTNADSCTQALLHVTNASSASYDFFPETEIPTNGGWQYSESQPEQEVIPQMFPGRSARTVLVPLPAESLRWRLRCRLWHRRSRLYWQAYHLLQDWRLCSGAEPPPEDRVVTSPEFSR